MHVRGHWELNSINPITFVLVDSLGAEVTGLGDTFSLYLSKAGGAFAEGTGTKSEIGMGWYKYVPILADADTEGEVSIYITGVGIAQQNLLYVVSGIGETTPDVPASYADLITYMLRVLGATGDALSLDASDLVEAVTETLLNYGVDTVAEATDQRKLRTLARLEAWNRALAEVATFYDFSDKSASYKRSQMYLNIEKQVKIAQNAALEFAPINTAKIITPVFVNDPYKKSPADFTVSDVADF